MGGMSTRVHWLSLCEGGLQSMGSKSLSKHIHTCTHKHKHTPWGLQCAARAGSSVGCAVTAAVNLFACVCVCVCVCVCRLASFGLTSDKCPLGVQWTCTSTPYRSRMACCTSVLLYVCVASGTMRAL